MNRSLWLRALTCSFFTRRPTATRQRRRALRRLPLALEDLEDRVTPSTVINVNDPSGGMDNPVFVTVGTLGTEVTLRDAINAANNTSATSSGTYLINLPAGSAITFTSPVNNDTIANNTSVQNQNWYGPDALPAISSNITIQGNGDTLQISGTNMRFFYVSGGPSLTGGALPEGTLELDHLTLEGGVAQGGTGGNNRSGGGGGLGAGGAIFNQGNLTLNSDTLTENQAVGGNGGSGNVNNYSGGGGGGMGSNGNSDDSGGGFGGNFSLAGGPQGGAPETVDGGGGGAGFQSGDNGNNAYANHGGDGGGMGGFGGRGGGGEDRFRRQYGGGAGGDGGGGGGGYGGAYGGSFSLGGDGGGGDTYGSGGGGGGIGGGGGGGGDGDSGSGGGGGFGGGGGGGTYQSDTQYGDGGSGGFGGGGGGGPNAIAGGGGFGGAAGTKAYGGGGGGGAGMGGGIFNMFGSLTIINSTLAGNTVQGGSGMSGGAGLGGALFNLDGNATLTYVTIANNNASTNGSGVYNLAYGNSITSGSPTTPTLTLINSVIGQDSGGNDLVNDAENGKNTNTAQINGTSSVVQGGAKQTGNGSNTVAPGAITVTSAPNLATTLTNYSGLTPTLAPNSGSPVLAAGNANIPGVNLPTVDQNGESRSSTNPDDGAFQTGTHNIATTVTAATATAVYNITGTIASLTANIVDAATRQPVTEGTVTFSVGGFSQSASLSPSDPGVARTQISLNEIDDAGSYTVIASYEDTGSLGIYKASSGNSVLTIQPANSSLRVGVANGPITYNSSGEAVKLEAFVTTSNGGAVLEGNVVIAFNGMSPVTLPVNGSLATTLNLSGASLLNAGNYPNIISAFYTDATNDYAAATATGTVVVTAAATTVTPLSVSTTYNSTAAQTLTVSATVAPADGGTVNEGTVTFRVPGTNLSATANVTNGTATATLMLPAGFAAGTYALTASYADPTNANGVTNYNSSSSTNAATLTVNPATEKTSPKSTTAINSANGQTAQYASLIANIASASGGTVNEGVVTFMLIIPNEANPTMEASVHGGVAAATLKLPAGLDAGSYTYLASYDDPPNANNVSNFGSDIGSATVLLTVNSGRATLGGARPPASPPSASLPPAGSSTGTPPVTPVASLSAFAFGFGPTGLDLFEVDSQGDVFAQSLFGGGVQLVRPSLQLPLALMSSEGLWSILAGDNGQNYFVEVFDPLLPFVEPAVLAALHL